MLRHCLDCTTAYAVDLTACPHCRSVRSALTPKTTAKPAVPAPRKATP